MNDSELQRQFKSLRVPNRDGDYWNSFPDQVLAQLRKPELQRAPEPSRFAQLSWNVSLALSCLVAFFCIWQTCSGSLSHVISKQRKEFRQAVLHLDENMRKVMRDEHGLHRLVEEAQ